MSNLESKIDVILKYLKDNGPMHYVDLTGKLKKKRRDLFPEWYTPKNLASSLSAEKTRNPKTDLVALGDGYFQVRGGCWPRWRCSLASTNGFSVARFRGRSLARHRYIALLYAKVTRIFRACVELRLRLAG